MGECGGCNKRAMWALKKMGYREEDGWLILGNKRVRTEEAKEYLKRITAEAVAERARAFIAKLKGD